MSSLFEPWSPSERRWNVTDLREEARRYKQELRSMMAGSEAFAALDRGIAGNTESSNVLGLGYGARQNDGDLSEPTLSLRVYVRNKLPKAALGPNETVPSDVNGIPTEVIPVGDVRAQTRPVQGGASVSHRLVTAGTLGCLVTKSSGDDIFILSNNHVLANNNQGAPGDPVVEPGTLDGGTNPIAELADFISLKFDGSINHVDAAIARVLNRADVVSAIRSIGIVPSPPMDASIYQSVRKSGRTTLHTVGVIKDVSADINIRYDSQTAYFEDLISIQGLGGPFSDRGDSGALIVDAVTKHPVALLIGGGAAATFACPIGPVLEHFGVEVAGDGF